MLIETFKHILLAVIQGATEVFPVSISGHLSIFGRIFDVDISLSILLIFHLGTFLAIMVFYNADIRNLLRSYAGRRCLFFMGIGFVATSIVGFAMKFLVLDIFIQKTEYITALLIINGIIIGATGLFTNPGTKAMTDLKIRDYLLVGIANGIATLPGISRLGMTLSVGLVQKMNWFEALKMSFLFSLPTIFFGNLYELVMSNPVGPQSGTISPISGLILIISFVVGLIALYLFSKYLGRELLIYFGGYCVAAGIFYSLYLRLF
jgi:undecaprenyl-diphosphatase